MRLAIVVAVLTVAGASISAADGIHDDWHYLKYDDMWPGRMGHASVSFDGRLYVLGGMNAKGFHNDVYYAVPEEERWERAPDAAWSPRTTISALVKDDKAWVVGGFDGKRQRDVWATPDMEHWECVLEEGPWPPRLYESVGKLDDAVFLLGGENENRRYNDVWVSENMKDWSQATEEAPWHTRSRMAVAEYDGKLWMTGGGYWDDDHYVYLNDVWTTTDGKDWTLVTEDADWTARCQHALVSNEGVLWLMGGDDDPTTTGAQRDVWVSRDGAHWALATSASRFQKNGYINATVHDGEIWVLGGMKYAAGLWNFKNDSYRLDKGSLARAGIEVP